MTNQQINTETNKAIAEIAKLLNALTVELQNESAVKRVRPQWYPFLTGATCFGAALAVAHLLFDA
jgi:hypothetical protein